MEIKGNNGISSSVTPTKKHETIAQGQTLCVADVELISFLVARQDFFYKKQVGKRPY